MSEDAQLFEYLEAAATGNSKYLDRILRVTKAVLRITTSEPHKVVLDVPAGMTRIRGVKVLPEGHEEPGDPGPIYAAIGKNFDGLARKARIFVHPDIFQGRSVAHSTSLVRSALMKEFRLR